MRHIHSFSQHASWKQVIKSALGGLCLASALLVGGQPAAGAAAPKAAVQQVPIHTQWSQQWAPEVRASLQELCERYGKNSPGYKENRRPYAILDFDNTTSIGNVQEQLMIWQLVSQMPFGEILEPPKAIEKLPVAERVRVFR